MIKTQIQNKLRTVFAHLDHKPDKRIEGADCWAHYDADRERDRFERLSENPQARAGTYEVANTGHPFAPPYRLKAQLEGDLTNGDLFREDALFLDLPVRTENNPTFLTTAHTHFGEEGILKLETVEGPRGTTARRVFSDYDEPWKDFVEEYHLSDA